MTIKTVNDKRIARVFVILGFVCGVVTGAFIATALGAFFR